LTPPPDQLILFDFPAGPRHTASLKPARYPVWTENKARLIERYLYYFVLVAKHGVYVDGFAGPQQPDKPETWAARLVLESEPRRLRKFFLYDADPEKVEHLERLKETQPPKRQDEPRRIVEVRKADFNAAVRDLLASGKIGEKEATFCLLDQQTFECRWATIEALAGYKQRSFKIELFYFLPTGWLDRAVANQRSESVLFEWWPDWKALVDLKKPQERAVFFCKKLQEVFRYASVLPWPIYERSDGGRIMYYMVHAADHPESPILMNRAYHQALCPKEEPEQFSIQFKSWRARSATSNEEGA
jgi:three-Cys-motif partner protein